MCSELSLEILDEANFLQDKMIENGTVQEFSLSAPCTFGGVIRFGALESLKLKYKLCCNLNDETHIQGKCIAYVLKSFQGCPLLKTFNGQNISGLFTKSRKLRLGDCRRFLHNMYLAAGGKQKTFQSTQ